MDANTVKFDFYGYKIHVYYSGTELLQCIEKDFSYFKQNSSNCDLKIEVFKENKRIEDIPEMVAAFSTPRNVCYFKDNVTYIDYFGKGLTIYDRGKSVIKIFSEDSDIAHEAAYQSILSLTGQYLDSKSYHRIHGIGFDVNGRAAIIMLDSGSGKTELAFKFLSSPQPYKLISEDTPLITRKCTVLPFPLRIGVVNPELVSDIPDEMRTSFSRIEFGPKYLVDVTYFKDKLSIESSSMWILVMGRRSTLSEPKIYPVSKFAIFGNVFKNYIMGLGVYQGLEFMLRSTPFDLCKKIGVVFSRFINSLILILRSKTFCLILSKDTNKNYEFLAIFLQKQENKTK